MPRPRFVTMEDITQHGWKMGLQCECGRYSEIGSWTVATSKLIKRDDLIEDVARRLRCQCGRRGPRWWGKEV